MESYVLNISSRVIGLVSGQSLNNFLCNSAKFPRVPDLQGEIRDLALWDAEEVPDRSSIDIRTRSADTRADSAGEYLLYFEEHRLAVIRHLRRPYRLHVLCGLLLSPLL